MNLKFNKDQLKFDNLFYQIKDDKKKSLSPRKKLICNCISAFTFYMGINILFAINYLGVEANAEIEKANAVFQLSTNINDALDKKDYKTALNESYVYSKTQNLIDRTMFNYQMIEIYRDKTIPGYVKTEMLYIAKNADRGLTLQDPLVKRQLSLDCGYLNIACNFLDNKLEEININTHKKHMEMWKESSYNLNNIEEYINYINLPLEEIKNKKKPYEIYLEKHSSK